MNFAAVYHRMADNMCYPLNDDDLIINIKTAYDVKQVFLHYGDPFESGILGGNQVWNGKREEIVFKKRLEHHIWWTTTVKPQFKRCRYYFELITAEEQVWYYTENGFYDEEHRQKYAGTMQCFTFPWMNPADIGRTPHWVTSTVWYQIFPERFCNGDPSINPKDTLPWAGPEDKVTNEQFYGGDLKGIDSKLNYLEDLGITGLYLTPINTAETSHKYDTTDYEKIDPHFGDKKVMQELVAHAHEKGMRVMLDGVFNHCGWMFQPWQDVVEKGPESEYFDWFMVNEWPFRRNEHNTRKGRYYSFAFADFMPKLNTNNPKVIEYLLGVCEMWVREYDIDGLRLDVANEISHKFCKLLRERMRSLKPDFYILGEIWHDSVEWLRGDEFDGVMNYPLAGSILEFWINEEKGKHEFEYAINRCYTMYTQQINDALFNLLDSHDTIRLITKMGSLDKFYQQMAVLFAMPGSTCIYYGTELALEGSFDPDCRRCMPWKEIEAGCYDDKIAIMKQLIRLRKENPLFRSRNFHFTEEYKENRLVEFIKLDNYGSDKMQVLLNCTQGDVKVHAVGEILFAHGYEEGILKKDGVLISKM
ncbi:MAG: glycoside hydrolase family 13 protein [Lachnospiraceae bacterium]|nr:glycoside hydrolase family 13 protein [Lachnospiraceae bacterium]